MRLLFIIFLFLVPLLALAQSSDTIVSRLVLIGDAGALTSDKHQTVVEAIERSIPLDKKTSIIFLGDNLYRHGLPDDQYSAYKDAKAVLDSQANIADHAKGMVYFIPGNHDWMNGGAGGFQAILREQRYLDGLGKKNLKFYPEDGCPGPIEVEISDDVVMIIMDSQWWIHNNEKPGIESECPYKTREEVVEEIKDIVSKNQRKLVIFACHHPFKTNGSHGGYYTIKQHIFPFTDIKPNLYIPLPGLGTIYPISRSVFGTPQDVKHPNYTAMINMVDDVLKTHPNVIHIAGHEHALEWIADSNQNYIVTGSGCRTARVSKSRNSKFEASQLGFAILDIYQSKKVTCTFYGAYPDSVSKLYSDQVLDFSKLPPQVEPDTVLKIYFGDKAQVAASKKYGNPNGFRKFMLGENYRKEWSEPVTLPVMHLKYTNGGYTITGVGGGFQTKSLHLKDKEGNAYNLRTIDKDPRKVLPPGMRSTFAKDVVQDVISGAHPYAPLVVSPMADAAGIINAKPKFYYIPNDPALGFYQPMFANKVVLLESRRPVEEEVKTKNTTKVINKLTGDNDHFVDQKSVLQARLLDMTIGDWDRHFDQWRWAVDDTGRGKLYYPIPRDRDQAFFRPQGAIMWVATKRFIPWMKGFGLHYNNKFNWLSHSPRNFDRIFMNGLDAYSWKEGIAKFQQAESDSVIENAVKQMPPEIYAIDGATITQSLKNRRDELTEKGMSYYRFLSKSVTVLGSNKDENFTVKQNDSGILVQVHANEKGTHLLMYSRYFDPRVTKEIRLFGFNGSDNFEVDRSVHTRTKIRMIGGRGIDTFDVKGRANSSVYDLSTELNPVINSRHTDIYKSSKPAINDYQVNNYEYDYLRFPRISLGYNPEDGALFGIGILQRKFGFRKNPYRLQHQLSTLYAPSFAAFQAKYRGGYMQLFRNYDLLLNADLQVPSLRNFYGYGNSTEIANGRTTSFYRARYSFASADVLVQKRLFGVGVLKLGVGPTVYHYWNDQRRNGELVLEFPQNIGLDSTNVYTTKTYVGGKIVADINNVNSELFPTRGIAWKTTFTALGSAAKSAKPFTDIHTDMNVYASLSDYARLIAVVRLGGGHIFSNNFEYFQSESVGADNYLRGFRKNRFSGRSMAYGSFELRAKIADINSYILPGTFGVVGFNDVARVWADGELSKKWHDSYGGGLYYIPFDLFIISATVARSTEQWLFNATIGTKLNLTF